MVTGSVDGPLSRRNLRANILAKAPNRFFQEHNQVTIE